MKGLIIIMGESFRSGSQNTRIRGQKESYDNQINACETHIKFLKTLNNKFKCNTSVFLSSYNTQYNDKLFSIYKNYLIGNKMYDNVIGLTQLFKNSIEYNNKNINDYDFIFYFRIDLHLKDKFIEIFNPNWNTIKFSFICWKKDSIHRGKPRVSDTMIFIPKAFFSILNKIVIYHDTWYMLSHDLNISDENLDVMVYTYHDSDSEKDYNPLYNIINRSQNSNWDSVNEFFIRSTNVNIIEKFTEYSKKKNYFNILFFIILICFLYYYLYYYLKNNK